MKNKFLLFQIQVILCVLFTSCCVKQKIVMKNGSSSALYNSKIEKQDEEVSFFTKQTKPLLDNSVYEVSYDNTSQVFIIKDSTTAEILDEFKTKWAAYELQPSTKKIICQAVFF